MPILRSVSCLTHLTDQGGRGRIGQVDASLIFTARALVLADLEARRCATPEAVSALEDAMSQRKWWAEQWPEGEQYVAGLVAQDVQDALFESRRALAGVRRSARRPEHALYIQPDLGGPDPVWVCEESAARSSRPSGCCDAERHWPTPGTARPR